MTIQSNKVAIVTGAAGGIGAAVKRAPSPRRFHRRRQLRLQRRPGRSPGRRHPGRRRPRHTAQADISDAAQVARMFSSAETAFGGVDVLVNNAGIMRLATIGDSDDALFDHQIAVNLRGTFNTLREASRRLRDGGRIINCPPAWSACCSRPTASAPPPRPQLRP
jgi:3-oxoacyl-[acyl-carrier protein] reductase